MAENRSISAPVAALTEHNHGGLVLITNAFGLISVLIFLVIRIFARAIISPPFDRDDIALVVATVGQNKYCSSNVANALSGLLYHPLRFGLCSRSPRIWERCGRDDRGPNNNRPEGLYCIANSL